MSLDCMGKLMKISSDRLYLQLFVGGLVSYLRSLWLFTYGGVQRIFAHLISFLYSVFCFVCLRLGSCVPNAGSFSGLSILDCPFGFL
jgi:hypothetical protein